MKSNIAYSKKESKIQYTEVEYVEGLATGDTKVQFAFYSYWSEYFEKNYYNLFFNIEDNKKLIIHNTFVEFWNKVRLKQIYVEEGTIRGKDGLPFTCSLTTYMMSVAQIQNKEIVRDAKSIIYLEDLVVFNPNRDNDDWGNIIATISDQSSEDAFLDSSDEQEKRRIVANIVSNMSERCYQILSMFYYKELKLDDILERLPSFNSKNALKSAKNKCMEKLKTSATSQYNKYQKF